MKIPQDTNLESYTETRDRVILLFLSLNTCLQVSSSCLALHKLFYPHLELPGKISPLSGLPAPKNPWNSILQPRLEMSRCNQISDLSPLGPCQCFSLWLFHKPLEQPLNPCSAGVQCRGWRSLVSKLCYVCGNQSLPHVLCRFNSWQKDVCKMQNSLYQHPLASSFTQNDTQENSSAFSFN